MAIREDGGVAVCWIDNPPVNGLSKAVRREIFDTVKRMDCDPGIEALVLVGRGRSFSGGADINELNTPAAIADPDLPALIRLIESSRKPVIAAIDGVCMGGGLELALGCHYRVAATSAQIAMPEVKLGLIPGGGGTQRLPRLLGLKAALDLVVSGATVPGGQLARSALFDCLTQENVLESALVFAAHAASAGGPWPRVRDRKVSAEGVQSALDEARASSSVTSAAPLAASKAIDMIALSVSTDFDTALEMERRTFFELLKTSESRALIHAFVGERKAAKIRDVPPATATRPIDSIAVVGAGLMGSGIAAAAADAGFRVTILEERQDALERGLAAIRRIWDSAVRKGRMSEADMSERYARLRPTTRCEAIAAADLVIEAVFESMAVKKSVFEMLDRVARPGAILASNTSTLDLDRLAAVTRRPHDVVGLHFFSPVNAMRLLEIVRGQKTSPDVIATVLQLAKKMRKVAVVAGVCDGFIGNRMIEQYLRQAGFLLEEGAFPRQVDQALEEFGMAMGPFRMCDLTGHDIGWEIRKRRKMEHPEYIYPTVLDKVCEKGRFGQKTGAGWYKYEDGGRTAHWDAQIDELILNHSASINLKRRHIPDEEVVHRCVLALVNEGARLLGEGIAQRASDIDVVYLNGYGFPRLRGGPMLYADMLGLQDVLRRFEIFSRNPHGEPGFWEPAPLLLDLARTGKTFN